MYRKVEVKPFIDVNTRDIIYKLKFITNRSVNSICEDLCLSAIKNDVISEFSPHFRREVKVGEVLYEANPKPLPFPKSTKAKTLRISLQLDDSIHEFAYNVAFSIGCSVAKVVALLLEKSMIEHKEIITHYIEEFISEKLNADEYKDLMTLIEAMNSNLPEEQQSLDANEILTSFVFYIFEEIKKPEESTEKAVLRVVNSWF